jgi:hypothetical protein
VCIGSRSNLSDAKAGRHSYNINLASHIPPSPLPLTRSMSAHPPIPTNADGGTQPTASDKKANVKLLGSGDSATGFKVLTV